MAVSPRFDGCQNDHRIKMTRSIDEIREELTSGACISFLEKLERLEGRRDDSPLSTEIVS